jgi:hypothetical protein
MSFVKFIIIFVTVVYLQLSQLSYDNVNGIVLSADTITFERSYVVLNKNKRFVRQ